MNCPKCGKDSISIRTRKTGCTIEDYLYCMRPNCDWSEKEQRVSLEAFGFKDPVKG